MAPSRFGMRDLPHIASGLVAEAAWAAAHMVMYPLGLLSAPARVTRQLSPTSPVIRELAQPAAGCRTRFIAFHSDIGHLSMPNNGRIALSIARAM